MKRAKMTLTLMAALLSMGQGVQAASDIKIAEACAAASSDSTGETRYTMIGVKKDHGHKRYSVWLNHNDRSARVFCRVNGEAVAKVVNQDGVWRKNRLRIPDIRT